MEILYKTAYIHQVCLWLILLNMAVLPETSHENHSVISKLLPHLTHTCLPVCMKESLKADFVILFPLVYTPLKFVLLGADKNIHYFRSIDSISFQRILSIYTYHFMIISTLTHVVFERHDSYLQLYCHCL